MNRTDFFAAVGVACAASVALAAPTITQGNATLQLIPTVPFSSSLPDSNLRPDGLADYLGKYGWSYRTPFNNQNRLMSDLDTPTVFTSGGLTRITWTNAGPGPSGQERFNAELEIEIIDDLVNPNACRVFSKMTVQNNANSTLTYNFFHLADIDMAGGSPNASSDDSVSFSGNTASFGEQSTLETGGAAAANFSKHEVNTGLNLRNKVFAGSFDLNDANGPVNGDASSAFQWTRLLAPGDSEALYAGLAINMTVFAQNPCLADLNRDGFVDDSDFVDFAGAYNDLLCPGAGPSRPFCLADLNNDGVVDDSDFVIFAAQYNTLVCP